MNASRRLQPGDTVRIRGERWTVQRQTTYGHISALDVRGVDAGNGGHVARFLLPFEPVDPIVAVRAPEVVRPTRWRALARTALATATPRLDSLRTAPRSRFDVMPFQLEPALAVTRGTGCRLLIADEVGLGKTVQAGLIVAELLDRQPDARALVVCPAGLRGQWQQELHGRFDLTATLLDEVGIAAVAAQFDATANPWSACRLVITSIDFIKRPEVMRAVEGLVWDIVVLDEAHNLATRSDRATAAAALAWRARTVVMLTATPHSGDDAAFARLCSLGDTSGRFPLVFFRRTRSDAGMPVQRRTRWLNVRPTVAEASMLDALVDYARRVWATESAADAARLAMTVLLRRASSSAASLVRSVERRLSALEGAPVSTEQLTLPFVNGAIGDEEPLLVVATPGMADAGEERRQLERVLSLARLAALRESKVAALARWLRRVQEPVLIFTEYRDTLVHVRSALTGVGLRDVDLVELHGGLTRAERLAAESSFTAGSARVLLATDAASEGLNLHHRCRCVINLESPWSPVRLEQRIGRVDRIGQGRCVHAINLVAAGTHETVTVQRLIERGQRAAGVLHGPATSDVETATAILSGIDLPADPRSVLLPASIRRPDLSAVAATEADWITTVRRLATPRSVTSRRPFVSALRRSPRRLLWVADVSLCDVDGGSVWTPLVGLEIPICGRAVTRHATAEMLATLDEQLRQASVKFMTPVAEAGTTSLKAAIGVAIDRERAICAAVRLRHARIAADLLQPGLFDHRTERRAAAQTSVLEEVLAHCQGRLDELAQRGESRIGPPVFRFAVLM